jgi:hypothetical protein
MGVALDPPGMGSTSNCTFASNMPISMLLRLCFLTEVRLWPQQTSSPRVTLMPSVDFHESFTRQDSVIRGSDRAFGFVMTGAFALLAAINLWHAGRIWPWMGLICVGFLVASLVRPSVLTPLNRLWFKLGLFLHKIVNPIVMGLLFYFAVLPTGLVMRLMGKDLLRLGLDRRSESYWIVRQPPGPQPESMRDQF